jgi:histidinol-phosphate aminotransferase
LVEAVTSPRATPRPDVSLMGGYHSPQLEVDVRLNTNEAPEQLPPAFLRQVEGRLGALELNRYPDREVTELRQALAGLHGVSIDEVYCANGSNEVLQSLLLAYGGPGRAIAVFEPTYALHSHIARITGTAVVEGERDDAFGLDRLEATRVFAEAAELGEGNPVVTFLCSPNNPTGRAEDKQQVLSILDRAPGLVVVDEAYGQFSSWSALELREGRPDLVVVRTFSKTWSLAGLRLGYAIADPQVVEAMFAVTLPYHLDSIKQVAGVVALSFESETAGRVARLVEGRGRLVAGLLENDVEVVPSDANFVLFRTPHHDAKAVWASLVEDSVLVRDVSSWPRLAGYLRVTVGTPKEIDAFLAALRRALR